MSAIPRKEGESQEDYKVRRKADHEATKKALAGTVAHDSYYYGTYKNPNRAAIKLERKARKANKKGCDGKTCPR